MSTVAQILRKAESLGVRLRADGDAVKMHGPREARDVIRADVVAHKPEIVAHLRAAGKDAESTAADCEGALRNPDGGLYLPWGPYLSPVDLHRLRSELVAAIEALAHLEGWSRETISVILLRDRKSVV